MTVLYVYTHTHTHTHSLSLSLLRYAQLDSVLASSCSRADLHLIFNMVNSSTSFRSVPESWMPICLPKFNDRGFLHAYVSYLIPSYPGPASDLCLVLVSPDRDKFFELSHCRKMIVQVSITRGMGIAVVGGGGGGGGCRCCRCCCNLPMQHMTQSGTLFLLQEAIRRCDVSIRKLITAAFRALSRVLNETPNKTKHR